MKFSFEDLDVWNLAVDFAEKIYGVTKNFPKDELYGLTSQFRRAALSVSANIAKAKADIRKKNLHNFCLSPAVHYMKR